MRRQVTRKDRRYAGSERVVMVVKERLDDGAGSDGLPCALR